MAPGGAAAVERGAGRQLHSLCAGAGAGLRHEARGGARLRGEPDAGAGVVEWWVGSCAAKRPGMGRRPAHRSWLLPSSPTRMGSRTMHHSCMCPQVIRYPASDNTCSVAVRAWYGEVAMYNWRAPAPYRDNWAKGIGHFTQLVRARGRSACGREGRESWEPRVGLGWGVHLCVWRRVPARGGRRFRTMSLTLALSCSGGGARLPRCGVVPAAWAAAWRWRRTTSTCRAPGG